MLGVCRVSAPQVWKQIMQPQGGSGRRQQWWWSRIPMGSKTPRDRDPKLKWGSLCHFSAFDAIRSCSCCWLTLKFTAGRPQACKDAMHPHNCSNRKLGVHCCLHFCSKRQERWKKNSMWNSFLRCSWVYFNEPIKMQFIEAASAKEHIYLSWHRLSIVICGDARTETQVLSTRTLYQQKQT